MPAIFETRLLPGVEDITRGKNRLGGDYGLHDVSAIVAKLPVNRSVRAFQRDEATLGAAVVRGGGRAGKGDGNRHGWYVVDTDHCCEISSDANVSTAVDEEFSGCDRTTAGRRDAENLGLCSYSDDGAANPWGGGRVPNRTVDEVDVVRFVCGRGTARCGEERVA